MKIIKKILLILLTIIISTIFVITVLIVYQKNVLKKVPYILDYTSFINVGMSMIPSINPGDLILLKKTDNYKVNDIITFQDENNVNTHRIIKVISVNEYQTKGDNNSFVDGKIVLKKDIYGVVLITIPKFSNFSNFILNNYIFIIAFIILIFIVRRVLIGGKRNNSVSSKGA